MKLISTIINKLRVIHITRKEYKEELTERQEHRLEICRKCPYNSTNYNKLSWKYLYVVLNRVLDRFYGLRVAYNAVCMVCGCGIVHMTTQEEEENKCKLKKW